MQMLCDPRASCRELDALAPTICLSICPFGFILLSHAGLGVDANESQERTPMADVIGRLFLFSSETRQQVGYEF